MEIKIDIPSAFAIFPCRRKLCVPEVSAQRQISQLQGVDRSSNTKLQRWKIPPTRWYSFGAQPDTTPAPDQCKISWAKYSIVDSKKGFASQHSSPLLKSLHRSCTKLQVSTVPQPIRCGQPSFAMPMRRRNPYAIASRISSGVMRWPYMAFHCCSLIKSAMLPPWSHIKVSTQTTRANPRLWFRSPNLAVSIRSK